MCVTIFGHSNVAYGAPAPREGVQPEGGGTDGPGGYSGLLPTRGYNRGYSGLLPLREYNTVGYQISADVADFGNYFSAEKSGTKLCMINLFRHKIVYFWGGRSGEYFLTLLRT